ncbi:MAG: hypothetical protein QM691_14830 [Opitutaceae bacterium]
MRIRFSSVARLLVGLVALCLILGGANWVRTGHAPHGDAVPHFEATAAVSQVWVADQPSSTSSVSAGLQFGPVPLWTAAIASLWLGLYCGRWAGGQRRGRSRRAPSPTEALVGVVELRL